MGSDKVYAAAVRGFDQIGDTIHRQLQAALQSTSDATVLGATRGKASSAAAAFMLESSGAGGSVDVTLSADIGAWPVASDLILDMQAKSSHLLVEACTTIADSFASLAKADTGVIRDALALSAL